VPFNPHLAPADFLTKRINRAAKDIMYADLGHPILRALELQPNPAMSRVGPRMHAICRRTIPEIQGAILNPT
jgi:hypothetical protein